MIKYHISYKHPHSRIVRFQAEFPVVSDSMTIQLPTWRPGRYEIGNFAKYLMGICYRDGDQNTLQSVQQNNHSWELNGLNGVGTIHVEYEFHAGVLNAGSCWLDETILYLNPVNCFLYSELLTEEPYELHFDLPDSYEIACSMQSQGKHELQSKNYQELMDSPLMASDQLIHWEYESNGIPFHLWFRGDHQLDQGQVLHDFQRFTDSQIKAFGGFPVEQYHFLFLFPQVKAYHGVEHEKSTVISLGPGMKMHELKQYEHFLGISSHELYHTWNVKNIRPIEMMPYDFSQPNYSVLGYVAEGVTTYLGDEFLYRSG
ncbi:MAG: M61 family peptidase, partial [Bacteroidota bacterium]